MPRGVYTRTEKIKLKMSEAHKGIPNSMKGKHHSEKSKQNMSEAHRGKLRSPHSDKTRRKMSEAKKGKPSNMKGKHHSDKTRLKISKAKIGKHHTEETRRKMRLAAANRGIPNYNPRACKYFDFINRLTNIEGQHALNGGEFLIKELGYYMDYYNPELKIIIEWDEPYHYKNDGNLRTRDVQRQKEIQELYPDFTFTRVKQNL